MNTSQIGDMTETKILAELLTRGYRVSIPFGGNCRYDLVVDDGKNLNRIQCKTARIRDGLVIFSTRSVAKDGDRYISIGYEEHADYFMAYCPENDNIYKIPVKDSPKVACKLRLEPSKSGQKVKVKLAKDYLF